MGRGTKSHMMAVGTESSIRIYWESLMESLTMPEEELVVNRQNGDQRMKLSGKAEV
jgi:hypothetical protein